MEITKIYSLVGGCSELCLIFILSILLIKQIVLYIKQLSSCEYFVDKNDAFVILSLAVL